MTIPAAYRLGPLVRAVAEQLNLLVVELVGGASRVTLRGSVVTVDDQSLDLSDTDARVLMALARTPGAVVTKPELLKAVWGTEVGDEHLVEVAVARLRQRLDVLGHHVVTVRRRGYALVGLQLIMPDLATPAGPAAVAPGRIADQR